MPEPPRPGAMPPADAPARILPAAALAPAARPLAPRARLAAEPGRFPLDQAALLAGAGGDPLSVTYRSAPRLTHATGEVTEARLGEAPAGELTITGFGLLGTGGALPRHLTATVAAEQRKRSPALHRFLDMLAGRFAGLLVLAGSKYRPTRDPVPTERALGAAIGLGTPHLASRAGVPPETLLYHAGHLAPRTRSAARLAALLEAEIGALGQVEILEFAGGWVPVPPPERSRLGGGGVGAGAHGQHAGLGAGAMIGVETWNAQSRFVIRIGPLDRAGFEALLPGRPLHRAVGALARLYAGPDNMFLMNLVLKASELAPTPLGGTARLGWSSWLMPPSVSARRDGEEPIFQPRGGTAPNHGAGS